MPYLERADPSFGGRCAVCGAAAEGDPGASAKSPTALCRKCGGARPPSIRPLPSGRAPPPGEILEAQRRPLVTYADKSDRAWAARIEADALREPRRPTRLPLTAAAVAAALFVSAFLGGREAAVAAIPDLAGLYAAIGLPVNLRGLTIEGVVAERSAPGAPARLTVRGAIRNPTDAERAVPPLVASVRDGADAPLLTRGFDAPSRSLPANASAAFTLTIDEAPRQAVDVVVRFLRPAETSPSAKAD